MAEGNGTSFAADIMELGDKIAALTITKAVQLKEYLKEKYKIEPAAGGVVMAAGPGGGGGAAAAEKPPEQTEFTVMLDGLADPAKKINVIKVVREITNLGLKEAKELVEGAPKPVKENVAKDEANTLKKKLEDGGAKASLK
ncbi:MAG TPA: 50S ribosomal protein L7/L12 [Gemmataceae bacterium]|nr:50S ribosomal protein L7/L12 [Gemmataceae bacterium]